MTTTAFVLSGGGSLGAVQVGMLQELAARGVAPDLLIGTSVGALNAAYVAGHGASPEAIDGLAAVWRGLRRRDVFPLNPARTAAALSLRASSLCSNESLRRLVLGHLTYARLEDAPIPVHLVATDVRSGQEVLLSEGDAADAILASAAIPAVFPPVVVGGRALVDGGISDNAAISQAIRLGADRVYVLPTGYACELDHPPTTALGIALQAMSLLVEQRLVRDVAHYAGRVDLRVLPPLCPVSVAPMDFRHAESLTTRARVAARRWIDGGGFTRAHPERFLAMHEHARDEPTEVSRAAG